MPTYRRPPAEVGQIVEKVLGLYHTPLRDAHVQIDCLFAYATTDDNGDKTGPALRLHGYACGAIVKILGLKDRTVGRGDAEILIDGDQWDTWGDDEKAALIDHEIEHLELKTDSNGLVTRDDLDRPKLRMRKHDHQFGWFDAIVRRHKAASFEFQQYARFQEAYTQRWLPFMGDEAQTAKASDDSPAPSDAPSPPPSSPPSGGTDFGIRSGGEAPKTGIRRPKGGTKGSRKGKAMAGAK